MLTEDKIKQTLRTLGVKTSNCGYSYITYGILLTLKDKSYMEYITKSLYVDIAHQFNTSAECVERDIRTVLESIWENGDKELLAEICGVSYDAKRPSNKKFFEVMYEYFTEVLCQNEGMISDASHPDFWCSKLDKECLQVKALHEETEKLRTENMQLRDMLKQKG